MVRARTQPAWCAFARSRVTQLHAGVQQDFRADCSPASAAGRAPAPPRRETRSARGRRPWHLAGRRGPGRGELEGLQLGTVRGVCMPMRCRERPSVHVALAPSGCVRQPFLHALLLASTLGGGNCAAASLSKAADAIACELCGVVSDDLFRAAVGIQGAGFGPTGFKFKEQFGAGDMIDVIDSLCHVEATPDWDEETQGLPPVALQHGYVLWQDADAGRYLVRRKDDIDESLIGKVMVDAHSRESTEIFFHACERHIRSIDVEVADNFAVVLKRHRKELKVATATNDYDFKEQLASSVRDSRDSLCSRSRCHCCLLRCLWFAAANGWLTAALCTLLRSLRVVPGMASFVLHAFGRHSCHR